jgi:hypothetical protein
VPKPPVISASGGSGGGKPGGLGKYFDKALYYFEYPYRSSSAILPPSSPKADLNNLTATGTPLHRKVYDPRIGGYYRFAKADTDYFTLTSGVADNQSEVFMTALVRPRGTIAGDSEYLFGGYQDTKAIDWRIGAERILGQTRLNTGDDVTSFTFSRSMAGTWLVVMFAYKLNTYNKCGINGAWVDTNTITNASFAGAGAVTLRIGYSGISTEYFDGDVAFLGVGTSVPTDRQIKYISNVQLTGMELPPPSGDGPPGDDPNDGATIRGRILLLGAG